MNKTLKKLIPWCFAGYFIILFAERIQSIARIIAGLSNGQNLLADGFDIYVFVLALISIAATAALLIFKNGNFFKALVGKCEPDYNILTIISGVALVSGMVHTEFTVAPIQFGAYGVLILGMVFETVISASEKSRSKLKLWYSLAYITAFSMAIPVVYKSEIPQKMLFHTIEAAVSLLLVFFFTVMLRKMFGGDGDDLLGLIPFIITVIGDAAIVFMNWNYQPNTFVMIFAGVTLIMFPVGKIIFAVQRKK